MLASYSLARGIEETWGPSIVRSNWYFILCILPLRCYIRYSLRTLQPNDVVTLPIRWLLLKQLSRVIKLRDAVARRCGGVLTVRGCWWLAIELVSPHKLPKTKTRLILSSFWLAEAKTKTTRGDQCQHSALNMQKCKTLHCPANLGKPYNWMPLLLTFVNHCHCAVWSIWSGLNLNERVTPRFPRFANLQRK